MMNNTHPQLTTRLVLIELGYTEKQLDQLLMANQSYEELLRKHLDRLEEPRHH
jgi:hypothetical protein